MFRQLFAFLSRHYFVTEILEYVICYLKVLNFYLNYPQLVFNTSIWKVTVLVDQRYPINIQIRPPKKIGPKEASITGLQ